MIYRERVVGEVQAHDTSSDDDDDPNDVTFRSARHDGGYGRSHGVDGRFGAYGA